MLSAAEASNFQALAGWRAGPSSSCGELAGSQGVWFFVRITISQAPDSAISPNSTNVSSGLKDAIMGDDKKQKFVGLLAQKAINGEISNELFKKIELAVNYSNQIKLQEVGNEAAIAVVDWLNRGGLERPWTFQKIACPECWKDSLSFQNKELMLVLCPNCMDGKTNLPVPSPAQEMQGLALRAKEIALGEKKPVPLPQATLIEELQGLSVQAREVILRATAARKSSDPKPTSQTLSKWSS